MENPLHFAALGSSFAAGPSIQPIENNAAGRSSNNYPHITARNLNARLTDLTVSGATLLNLLDEPQQAGGQTFPPQVSLLPSDVDVVLITGGGNDIGYVGGMFHDSLSSYLPFFLPTLLARFWKHPSKTCDVGAEDVTERFVKIIDRILETSPKAKIYLVEYLTILDEDTEPHSPGIPLTAEQIAHHRQVNVVLTKATEAAVEARKDKGVGMVYAGMLSEGHGAGSKEPWMTGYCLGMMFGGAAPWHPNAEGHQAVARMVEERLKEDDIAGKQ